jgi:hypothetical protein
VKALLLVGVALAGCGGSSGSPVSDAGTEASAPPPFAACQLLVSDPDAGGLDAVQNVTCGDEVLFIRWGWDADSRTFAGACDGDREAGCVVGSPCVVATADAYLQGGCL